MSKTGLIPAQILLNHRQKIYAYYLLIFPNDHLIKKILPISFWNKNANFSREKKQPEDLLIWASKKRPNSFSQWLPWQISNTLAVDLDYGVELVEKS